MNVKTFTFLLVLLTFTFLLLPLPVHAKVSIEDRFAFGDIGSLGAGVTRLVLPVFSIAIAVVIILFLIGAFELLTSGGNKEEVANARNMITHVIIGFIILMMTFLILQFALSSLFGITSFNIIQGP